MNLFTVLKPMSEKCAILSFTGALIFLLSACNSTSDYAAHLNAGTSAGVSSEQNTDASSDDSDEIASSKADVEISTSDRNDSETVWLLADVSWTLEGETHTTDLFRYDENGNLLEYVFLSPYTGKQIYKIAYSYYEDGSLRSYEWSKWMLSSEEFDTERDAGMIGIGSHYLCDPEYLYKEYDENGNVILSKSAVSVNEYSITTYDANGKVLTSNDYDSQGNQIGWEDHTYDDNGNLLSIVSYEYGEIVSSYEYTYFDSSALQSSTHTYYEGASISDRYYTTYDESGNKIIDQSEDFDNGIITKGRKYTYDENGNKISYVEYSEDSVELRIEYLYDENGNVLEKATYDGSGRITNLLEYVFDLDGNLLKETTYAENDTITTLTEYIYDESGNLISKTTYDGNLNITDQFEYTYDENGALLTKSNDTQGTRINYVYDESGNILKFTKYENEELLQQHEYTYDEDGYELSVTEYENGELILQREYTYDEDGNILSITEYENGELILQREYTYDEDGNILSAMDYENGESSYTEYTWDSEGNCLPKKSYNGDGILVLDVDYTLEQEEIVDLMWYSTTPFYQICYLYYVEIYYNATFYEDDGSLYKKFLCQLDENGKLLSYSIIYSDGEVYMEDYSYDSNGNLTQIVFSKNGEITKTYTYTWIALEY